MGIFYKWALLSILLSSHYFVLSKSFRPLIAWENHFRFINLFPECSKIPHNKEISKVDKRLLWCLLSHSCNTKLTALKMLSKYQLLDLWEKSCSLCHLRRIVWRNMEEKFSSPQSSGWQCAKNIFKNVRKETLSIKYDKQMSLPCQMII